MATDVAIEVPVAAPAARTRPKWIPIAIVSILVVAGAVWGTLRYLFSRHHVTTDNAQVDGHITVISPRISGFVARVLVDDNQHVKAGDTLVVLDDRDTRVRLQQAEADLRSAEAATTSGGRAGQAQAQLQATRAEAASAAADVEAAEAAYRRATADLDRYRGLAAKQIISAQQLDAAQAEAESARANLQAAQKRASAAGSQVSASGAALRGADARLASAEAAAADARLQESYAAITAPVDGIVARRSAETGALVQVGQNLISIVPDRDVWVTANLKETQLATIQVGDSVEFTVDAYPGEKFRGMVESLSPATGARFALLPPDNATGNFTKVVQRLPVRIAVEQPPSGPTPLRPGMSVDVTITTR
ncbi:MAG TPA: HlyD family secretion protein [Gemmatimonadales bacterium]|jgi:membrane fusion protein (multidrug efflux system)